MAHTQQESLKFPGTAVYAAMFLLAVLLAQPAMAARNDKPSTSAITPAIYVSMLGKGMDVDWSKTGQGMRNYSAQTPRDFKQRGFSHVRIRIKDAANADLFSSLDAQINDCLKSGLIPIIAYQANKFKNNPNDKTLAEAVAWWRTVSARYANVAPQLAFDLLIEATDAMNANSDWLNAYFEQATAAIRATNPQRIVMISPRIRSNPNYLGELKIPSTGNGFIMAEWHFDAAGPKNWTTGTPAEKQAITDLINVALQWQQATNIPTWVGAWMPGDYNRGGKFDVPAQINFASFVACALDNARVPFAINSDTKFYDRKKGAWIKGMQPVLDSILHPRCR